VQPAPDEPGLETPIPYFRWRAANADYVLILGLDQERHPAVGQIDARQGSFVFVAVGRGGEIAVPAGLRLESRHGPGLHGIVYNLRREFHPETFFEHAYKDLFQSKFSVANLRNRAISLLQGQNYSAAQVDHPSVGPLVYTLNFNPHPFLRQTPQQRAREGTIDRQIGYVIGFGKAFIEAGVQKRMIYILPMVRRNFPYDDNVWRPDPDELQLGIRPSRQLANQIFMSSH
jgi:hypothetical protein